MRDAPSEIRQRIVAEARKLIGTRFWWYGRDSRGLDCYGLVYAVGRAVGIEVPDLRDYSPKSVGDRARLAGLEWFRVAALDSVRAGDIVEYDVRGRAQHYGIITGEATVVRAQGPRGPGVTENTYDPLGRFRPVGAYSFPGVD